MPDEAFRHLLPANYEDGALLMPNKKKENSQKFKKDLNNLNSKISDPIKIPSSRNKLAVGDLESEIGNCKNNSSPDCSSLGSFVIVDMKTPFANDQNDLGSFFNGPSPTFRENNLADELEDITTQLAQLESNCNEWSSFVESITSKEDEEI